MASSDGYFARPGHRYLHVSGDHRTDSLMDSDSVFEFDESDIYNSVRVNSLEFRKPLHATSHHRSSLANKVKSSAPSSSGGVGVPASASVPVNIPDWSKILGSEYRDKRWRNNNNNMEEYEAEGGGWDCDVVPPHEFLARTRVASSSVHEGVGRTLKGRDLSRVRNAIWAKTGFSD